MNPPEPKDSDIFDLDIDPMLFFAAVIEDNMPLLTPPPAEALGPLMGDMGAIAGFFGEDEDAAADPFAALFGGVADIAREHIASAQEQLDRLIEADDTWRPA